MNNDHHNVHSLVGGKVVDKRTIINNYGITPADYDKLCNVLSEYICSELPIDKISQEVKKVVVELVENKPITKLLSMINTQVNGEDEFRRSVLEKFADMSNDIQSIKEEIIREYNELSDEHFSDWENLERLNRDIARQADEAFGKIINMLSELKDIAKESKENIRLECAFELTQGWVNIRNGRFEEAEVNFNSALKQVSNEADAYFGLYLVNCKIQVLWDCVNCRWQPICHDIAAFDNKFEDNTFYKSALTFATSIERKKYEEFNKEIKYIIQEFKKLGNRGVDFKCFICAKTKDNEQTTKEYQHAKTLYYALKEAGCKPFYADIQCNQMEGNDYEAYILYALYKAKYMIIVCSNEEYLKTPWVKNEYTRYIDLIHSGDKQQDSVKIAYIGAEIQRLPGMRHAMQGINLNERFAIEWLVNIVSQFLGIKENAIAAPNDNTSMSVQVDEKPDAKSQQGTSLRSNSQFNLITKEAKKQSWAIWSVSGVSLLLSGLVLTLTLLSDWTLSFSNYKGWLFVFLFALDCMSVVAMIVTAAIVSYKDVNAKLDGFGVGVCGIITFMFSMSLPMYIVLVSGGVTIMLGASIASVIILLVCIVVRIVNHKHMSFSRLIVCTMLLPALFGIACFGGALKIDMQLSTDKFYENEDGSYTCVWDTLGINENIVIPAEYNGKPITRVVASSGLQRDLLVSNGAYNKIKSIYVPNSAIEMDPGIFACCGRLESLTIPYIGYKTTGSVTDYDGDAECIQPLGYLFGHNEFDGASATLQYFIGKYVSGEKSGESSTSFSSTYYIPQSLKYVTVLGGDICDGAFNGCENIQTITLGNNVNRIGRAAFEECKGLIEINIPKSIEGIGRSAFQGCTQLASVKFEDVENWYVDQTNIPAIDLQIYATSAKLLSQTYYNKEWTKQVDVAE